MAAMRRDAMDAPPFPVAELLLNKKTAAYCSLAHVRNASELAKNRREIDINVRNDFVLQC